MIELMNTVRLNNARIEQLVNGLYGLNRRLIGMEGRLLRMAVDSKVKREDPSPLLRLRAGPQLDRPAQGLWARPGRVFERHTGDILRPQQLVRSDEAEPIGEFRRIVSTVQKGEKEASSYRPGNGRGQPRRHLDRQEVHEPRPSVPRPDQEGNIGLMKAVDMGVRVPARL